MKNRGKKTGSVQKSATPINKKFAIAPFIVIIVLGCIVYANSLNGKFIWDDTALVQENVFLRNFSNISRIFTENVMSGSGRKTDSYRPLQTLSYLADHSIAGLSVRMYHFTNILLHIAAALTLYRLINLLCHNRRISLFTAVFFVIHPVHTEAVSYISGRADPLAAFLMLLSFVFYLKYLSSGKFFHFVLITALYTLAVLSKEASLIFPALILLYHYAFKAEFKPKGFISVACAAVVYILLRFTLLRSLIIPASSDTTLFQRVPGFFVAIFEYTRMLFLPFDLHMEYGKRLFDFTDPRAILGVLISLVLLIYAFRKRTTDRLAAFCVFWFFITILPVSNLYGINAYMAEHWLYFPSIGLFVIFSKLLSELCDTQGLRVVGILSVSALVIFYSSLTIMQNRNWRDPVTFYERLLKYAPDSSRVHYNLGNVYRDAGNINGAIESYKKAIEIKPDYNAYNNLGNLYRDIGNMQDAVAAYKEAIRIEPSDPMTYYNMGAAYCDMGRTKEAIAAYKEAIGLNPSVAAVHYNLGNAYLDIGMAEEAIASYNKAIEINPDDKMVYNNLGIAYGNIGKVKEAIAAYKKAIELSPGEKSAYNNLAYAYTNTGNYEEAMDLYKKALEIDPNFFDVYNNLGLLYEKTGDTGKAVASYKKAIAMNPRFAQAYRNLSELCYKQGEYALSAEYCNKAKDLGLTDSILLEKLKSHEK